MQKSEVRDQKSEVASSVPELLPCPFCGAPGLLCKWHDHAYVRCMNDACPLGDDAPGFHLPKVEDAIDLWNRRAEPDHATITVPGYLNVHVQSLMPQAGIVAIAAERFRQVHDKGFTPEHDDQHTDGSLAHCASMIAAGHRIWVQDECPDWSLKRAERVLIGHDRIRQLAIAGALIAAEIDRLKRSSSASSATSCKKCIEQEQAETAEKSES